MTVWVLVDREFDSIAGIYTTEAKLKKEQQLAAEAVERRDFIAKNFSSQIERLLPEIASMRAEVEALISEEAAAKEANHTGVLKKARKKRSMLLNHIKEKCNRLERCKQCLAELVNLTEQDVLYRYGTHYCFEEYALEEA